MKDGSTSTTLPGQKKNGGGGGVVVLDRSIHVMYLQGKSKMAAAAAVYNMDLNSHSLGILCRSGIPMSKKERVYDQMVKKYFEIRFSYYETSASILSLSLSLFLSLSSLL